jgi:ribosome-associated heat shock protein Hsp15
METKEKIRADKYLWSIRIFKTRSIAAEACERNKVKLNGVVVKPAKTVNVGDVFDVRTEARKWVVKVTAMVDHRLPYAEAIKHYEDITPEEDKSIIKYQPTAFETGKRLSKIGRPTKKDRRDIGDIMDGVE